jgi:hypothetical protein
MSVGEHRHLWTEHCRDFAEVTELLANRSVDVANAGGRIISVSHAVDPDDPSGSYSVIILAEAPEEVEVKADVAAAVVRPPPSPPKDHRPVEEIIAELKERGVDVSIDSPGSNTP